MGEHLLAAWTQAVIADWVCSMVSRRKKLEFCCFAPPCFMDSMVFLDPQKEQFCLQPYENCCLKGSSHLCCGEVLLLLLQSVHGSQAKYRSLAFSGSQECRQVPEGTTIPLDWWLLRCIRGTSWRHWISRILKYPCSGLTSNFWDSQWWIATISLGVCLLVCLTNEVVKRAGHYTFLGQPARQREWSPINAKRPALYWLHWTDRTAAFRPAHPNIIIKFWQLPLFPCSCFFAGQFRELCLMLYTATLLQFLLGCLCCCTPWYAMLELVSACCVHPVFYM